MNRMTCIFLVLLRLAIGWHFAVEGMEKVKSPTWSSEPYLRESSGPMAPMFRWMAGDSVADRYRVVPLRPDQDSRTLPKHERFPPALDREWNRYFDRFVAYYALDAAQLKAAQTKLEQRKEETARWLIEDVKKVKKESPYGSPVEVTETSADRLRDYDKKLQEVNELQDMYLTTFGPDLNARLRSAKTDLNRQRNELRADIDLQTDELKKALRDVLTIAQLNHGLDDVLTDVQKEQAEVKKSRRSVSTIEDFRKMLPDILTPDQLLEEPVPTQMPKPWEDATRLERIDWLTRWGVLAVGICLVTGFLTRSACVLGALFLFSFYLAMPSLPWVPTNPRAEGHYFIINKNIIEMIALLTLSTTRSGRWLGLDGLVQFLNPWRWCGCCKSDPARSPLVIQPSSGQPRPAGSPTKDSLSTIPLASAESFPASAQAPEPLPTLPLQPDNDKKPVEGTSHGH